MLDDDALAREQIEDALVDGDVPFERGTAQAALRHRNFRIVYVGTFASNIGTWMQNVVLGAYAFKLTGSSAFVGLLYFGQLGPLLFLSTFGGAGRRGRPAPLPGRRAACAALLLVRTRGGRDCHASSLVLITLCVFAIGVANALGAPGLNAILPMLVPKEDLPGAVALASVQMNLSRVIGPPIGADLLQVQRRARVRRQRSHVSLRGDRAVVGHLSPAHQRQGRGAGIRPAALRRADRTAGPGDLADPLDALLVLVLLADVRRPVPGDRPAELRDRDQELAVRRSLRASGSAPRSGP